MLKNVLILIFSATVLFTVCATEAAEPLQVMDIFDIEHASDPQISPDGSQVVYTRNWSDVMTDTRYMNLWIVNADGTGSRPISTGKHHAHSPRWSPDGKRLAFISTEGGSAQIYTRWMDTGDTAAVTNLTESPGSFSWSPDGQSLAFSKLVPATPLTIGKLPAPPAGAEWAPPAKMTDRLVFRFDRFGEIPSGYTQMFVIPAAGGKERQVTHGDYFHGGFAGSGGSYAWTADSQGLIVSANRSAQSELEPKESDLWAFPLSGGEPTRLTNRLGPDSEVTVSPDGKTMAYTGFDDRHQGYQVTQLYVAGIDGSNPKSISAALDRSVSSPVWAADGKSIYALFDSEGVTQLGRFSLSGKHEILAEGLGSGHSSYGGGEFSLSRNGTYALTLNRPDRSGDVGVGRNGAGLRQVTDLNSGLLSQRELGAVEEIWWESSKDQRRIQGWIVKPPGFDASKKYPLILEMHGGPFANYGPRFDMEKQLMAAAGYVVLYSNPRGSTSYGEAFGNLIHHAYPGDDFYDLNSGVDAVIARGYVDPDQLYVTGGSGGGVLTAWMIGHTNRFRAAMPFYPVINWESFVLTADISAMVQQYWFGGFPWDERENYETRSLLAVSGKVQTPTLIMTGEEDWRTPMSESEQYYKALKLQGVEAVLVRVPGEGHGIRARPSHAMAKMTTLIGWFAKHSGKE